MCQNDQVSQKQSANRIMLYNHEGHEEHEWENIKSLYFMLFMSFMVKLSVKLLKFHRSPPVGFLFTPHFIRLRQGYVGHVRLRSGNYDGTAAMRNGLSMSKISTKFHRRNI